MENQQVTRNSYDYSLHVHIDCPFARISNHVTFVDTYFSFSYDSLFAVNPWPLKGVYPFIFIPIPPFPLKNVDNTQETVIPSPP